MSGLVPKHAGAPEWAAIAPRTPDCRPHPELLPDWQSHFKNSKSRSLAPQTMGVSLTYQCRAAALSGPVRIKLRVNISTWNVDKLVGLVAFEDVPVSSMGRFQRVSIDKPYGIESSGKQCLHSLAGTFVATPLVN